MTEAKKAHVIHASAGLQELTWSKVEENKKDGADKSHLHGNSIQDPKQSTISDFMT